MGKFNDEGVSYLCSFPFWVFVDQRSPPHAEMLEIGGHKIRVYPPFRSAEPNFIPMPAIRSGAVPFLKGRRPKHIKDSDPSTLICLATMPILAIQGVQKQGNSLIWGADWGKEGMPVAFPMDSLRIDVFSEEGSDVFLVREFVNKIMANVRVISRQWWLSSSIDPLVGWVRNEFPIDSFGKPTGEIYGFGQARAPRGHEKVINSGMWSKSLRQVENDIPPPVYELLLLDAEYYFASKDFRRFIMDASTACELVKEITFERLWLREKDSAYRRGKLLSGYDLGKHLDGHLNKHFGRSLRQEKPHVFAEIENLWDARGNVAHGESAFYRDGEKKVVVDETRAANLMNAADDCVRWLLTL